MFTLIKRSWQTKMFPEAGCVEHNPDSETFFFFNVFVYRFTVFVTTTKEFPMLIKNEQAVIYQEKKAVF